MVISYKTITTQVDCEGTNNIVGYSNVEDWGLFDVSKTLDIVGQALNNFKIKLKKH